MHDYISYETTVEERIADDREVRIIAERLGVWVLAAWNRLRP